MPGKRVRFCVLKSAIGLDLGLGSPRIFFVLAVCCFRRKRRG